MKVEIPEDRGLSARKCFKENKTTGFRYQVSGVRIPPGVPSLLQDIPVYDIFTTFYCY